MDGFTNRHTFSSRKSSNSFSQWFNVASLVICVMFCFLCGLSKMERRFNEFCNFLTKCFSKDDSDEDKKDSTTSLIGKKNTRDSKESLDDLNFHKSYYYKARKMNNSNVKNEKVKNEMEKTEVRASVTLSYSTLQNQIASSFAKDPNFKMGDLSFVVIYNIKKNTLMVNILEVQNLIYNYNCYIIANLSPGSFEIKITKVQQNSKNPKFFESFVFNEIVEDTLKDITVNFRLYVQLESEMDQLIAETTYPLNLLLLNALQNDERNALVERQLTPVKIIDKSLGNIQLSLNLDMKKQKMIVQIIGCKNLKAMNSNNSSNPYCSIQLGTAKTNMGSKTTSIKYYTLNPIWKEKFVFPVSQNSFNDDLCLVIKIYHKNKQENNEIGQITFPSVSGSTEFSQWASMQKNKGEFVTEWHDIKCG